MRSLLTRPYDVAMDEDFRKRVRRRRENPDGMPHDLPIETTGAGMIYRYPWNKMQLGDFFLVPLNGQLYDRVRNRMQRAAMLKDIEVVCVPFHDKEGIPCCRVTYTCGNIRSIKKKAQVYHGVKVRFHDKETYRRAARERQARYRQDAKTLRRPDEQVWKVDEEFSKSASSSPSEFTGSAVLDDLPDPTPVHADPRLDPDSPEYVGVREARQILIANMQNQSETL